MKVVITNNTGGPRVVTALGGGQVTIPGNGGKSPEIHMADHEVARYDAREGFEVEKLGASPKDYLEGLAESVARKRTERTKRETPKGSSAEDADEGTGTEESTEGQSGRHTRRKKAGARKTR